MTCWWRYRKITTVTADDLEGDSLMAIHSTAVKIFHKKMVAPVKESRIMEVLRLHHRGTMSIDHVGNFTLIYGLIVKLF